MLPTLREKRHYIAVEVLSKSILSEQEIKKAIYTSISEFLGYEAARAGMHFIEFDNVKPKYDMQTFECILSINRKYDLKVKAALALLSEINGKPASCRVLGVSGTLKRLREKFLHQKKVF